MPETKLENIEEQLRPATIPAAAILSMGHKKAAEIFGQEAEIKVEKEPESLIDEIANILTRVDDGQGYDLDNEKAAQKKLEEALKLLKSNAGNLKHEVSFDIESSKAHTKFDLSKADIPNSTEDRKGFIDLFTLGYGFNEQQKAELEDAIAKALKPSDDQKGKKEKTALEVEIQTNTEATRSNGR